MNALPIAPHLIAEIFYYVIFLLCFFLFVSQMGSDTTNLLLQKKSPVMAIVLVVAVIILVGLRPAWFGGFGDTVNYARSYQNTSPLFHTIDWGTEWLFSVFKVWCKAMGFTVNLFFLLIAIGYFGFMMWAFYKALWENVWFAMMFALSAFSVLSYGINGIRNGLACSMMILAIIFASKDKNLLIAALLSFLALGIHKSVMLPIAALLVALFLIKKVSKALLFWIMSIPISLMAGDTIAAIFVGWGFDDRMDAYLSAQIEAGTIMGQSGFRWDFLLYSAMPVWLIWYVQRTIDTKRDQMGGYCQEEVESGVNGAGIIADTESMRVFNTIATIYLLTNAFWVMVIRASFSNRFAYLSWFLYPLVVAYAVIRLHIWKDQDKKAGIILFLHASFTLIMHLLGKV